MADSSRNTLKNKGFNLFLFSQGASCFGDAFQLIAVVTMLLSLSGKGIAATFGIIAYPFVSIIFSVFGGSLGDRFTSKNIMILIDLARMLVILCFIFIESVSLIYLLIVLLSMLDTLYSPVRRKLIVTLLKKDELLAANLILNGILGAAFVIGPAVAGVVITSFSYTVAFIIKALSCLSSAALLSFIGLKEQQKPKQANSMLQEIKEGYHYCRNEKQLKFIILITSLIFSGVTCINIAFYPYAFDEMKLTPKIWSLMMSVYYGAGFLTLIISDLIEKKIKNHFMSTVYFSIAILSVIWFFYGLTEDTAAVFLLQAIEGFTVSTCLVIVNTQLLMLSKKRFASRVSGVNDLFNNFGKLGGIAITYPLLRIVDTRYIFYVTSMGLFSITSITFLKQFTINKNIKLKNHY